MTLYHHTTNAIAAHAAARATAAVARLTGRSRTAEAMRLRRVASEAKSAADRAWLVVAQTVGGRV